jgi:hypothetical protein
MRWIEPAHSIDIAKYSARPRRMPVVSFYSGIMPVLIGLAQI